MPLLVPLLTLGYSGGIAFICTVFFWLFGNVQSTEVYRGRYVFDNYSSLFIM
jgi:hypothetical protein